MRQDFRVKVDFSRLFQDARQNSWVFINSAKILQISHLAEHVQKLFDIKNPFHLLSKYEETYLFLPFEEDIRILENNDTVLIVPGTGITNKCETANVESTNNFQNVFVEPMKYRETESTVNFEKSTVSEKSPSQTNIENSSDDTVNNSLYRTAHAPFLNDTEDSKITEDNFTEDNSIVEESILSNKRKRVRKRKHKKVAEVVPESDVSLMEYSGKKPKIMDSILISSGKHIRFEGLNNEDTTSDSNVTSENNNQVKQNGTAQRNKPLNKDLCALLRLRQSSTPITFAHKKIKQEEISEKTNETKKNLETNCSTIKSETTYNTTKSHQLNKTNGVENSIVNSGDTVSFKVFRMGEDYTPQLSDVILAKVLSQSSEGSEYTLRIFHGKDQLSDPEGKFSLPKEDEDEHTEQNDVITLEKTKLLELTRIKAIEDS